MTEKLVEECQKEGRENTTMIEALMTKCLVRDVSVKENKENVNLVASGIEMSEYILWLGRTQRDCCGVEGFWNWHWWGRRLRTKMWFIPWFGRTQGSWWCGKEHWKRWRDYHHSTDSSLIVLQNYFVGAKWGNKCSSGYCSWRNASVRQSIQKVSC